MPHPRPILAGNYSARVAAGFGWYTRRLFAKHFHAVRITPGSVPLLQSLDAHAGPVIIAMSHASWWDPLVAVLIGRTFLLQRSACAPMERAQLEKFAFFKRLGLFGVDPDDPSMLPAMGEYVRERFAKEPRPTLYITPQGRFADPRAPLEVRPGVAAIASAHPGCRVVCLAIEYPFWTDQRPEVLLHAREVMLGEGKSPSTPRWHQSILTTLQSAMSELAAVAIARDPAPLTLLVGKGGGINPVYDLWLRLRGKGRATIESDRVPGSVVPSLPRESTGAPRAKQAGT